MAFTKTQKFILSIFCGFVLSSCESKYNPNQEKNLITCNYEIKLSEKDIIIVKQEREIYHLKKDSMEMSFKMKLQEDCINALKDLEVKHKNLEIAQNNLQKLKK